MSYEREGVTYERFDTRNVSERDTYYVVRLRGIVVGVARSCILVRHYKTVPSKTNPGFVGIWPNGVERCARSRRVLAEWMIDHPDGVIFRGRRSPAS